MKKEALLMDIDYEKIIEMFGLDADEEIYFNCKGKVKAEDVVIEEDYTWSEAAGMLYGSELEYYIVTKEGIDKSHGYANYGTNLSDSIAYILYSNYNNNNLVSYSIDVYEIE